MTPDNAQHTLPSLTARPRPTASLRGDVRWVLSAFLIWRMSLSLWAGIVGPGLLPSPFEGDPIYEAHRVALPSTSPLSDFLLAPWYRWDAGQYLKIATLGYAPEDGSTAFPPLYPLMIRLATPLALGNPFLAALFISNVAFVGVLLLLLWYLKPNVGTPLARWTVISLMVFPSSFFFLSAYTESLYLFLALAALHAARERRWGWAWGCALLAGFTRFQGVALALPLAWEWWQVHGPRPAPRVWPQLLSATAAPMSVAAFLLWTQLSGAGGLTSQYASKFSQFFSLPWNSLWQAAHFLLSKQAMAQDWMNAFALLLCLILCLWMLPRLPVTYSMYAWANLFVTLCVVVTVAPLLAFVRYLLVNFPVFVMLACFICRHRWFGALALIVFGLLQLLLVWMYTHWRWVA